MQMKREIECGCGLHTCNVTGTIQISTTADGNAAVILAARDNNTADLVSIILDARAIDAINNMWLNSVARRLAYETAVNNEPHSA